MCKLSINIKRPRGSTGARLTFVPGLPVLSSSSDVGDSQDSPQMSDKDEPGDAVARRDGDVKTAVAVQETRMGAVQFDALLVNDEHGDLSAVLGGIKDLAQNTQKDKNRTGNGARDDSGRICLTQMGSSESDIKTHK